MRRVLSQFSPHDFTAFKWGTATDFLHYFTVVLLLLVFLAAELNPFYLKARIEYFSFEILRSLLLDRAYCGWSLIIQSLFFASHLCFYVPSPRCENFTNMSMIQGTRSTLIIIYIDIDWRCVSINLNQACSENGTACLASFCHDCDRNTRDHEVEQGSILWISTIKG